MPGQRRLETHIFKSLTLLYVQHIFIKKTYLPEYPDTQRRLTFARCKIPKFDVEEKKKKKTYAYLCPDNVDSRLPVVRSQITIELSPEPLAKELGFVGWKATLVTVELLSLQQLSIHHFLLQFEI